MKILLLCKKGGHKLIDEYKFKFDYVNQKMLESDPVNGKIIGECDFNVEDINAGCIDNQFDIISDEFKNITQKEIIDKLPRKNFGEKIGYAIHVDNINFFTEPQEISEYYYKGGRLKNMPKTMLVVQKITNKKIKVLDKKVNSFHVEEYIILPCSSIEIYNIWSHKQDVIIRNRILKCMRKENQLWI